MLATTALSNMCIVNVFFPVHSFCSVVSTMSFVKEKFGIFMNFSLKVFFFVMVSAFPSYEIFVYRKVMKIISYIFFLKSYNFIFYTYINGPFKLIMLRIV